MLVDGNDALVLAGIALLLVGLGFKVAAVPFHVWTPDVYQGAPTPVTAFMASVGKVAAFAAMLRCSSSRSRSTATTGGPAIWVLAVLSLVVGSVLAVVQTNVKRMLAYSSISHAGFILVGVEAAAHRAGEADSGRGDAERARRTCCCTPCWWSARSRSSPLVARQATAATPRLEAFRGLGRSRSRCWRSR